MSSSDHCEVLIIGAGSGGVTVAAHLLNSPDAPQITLLDPSEKHYYQPLWTLVGGGVFPKEITERDQKDVIPNGARWIKDGAARFDPDKNQVHTASGRVLTYDQLVVAAGIQINWHLVKGLAGQVGKGGICSNYSYKTVESTWAAIRGLNGGHAVFTHPATPIKCGGAPQKIMYLAEDHFRRVGRRDQVKVSFFAAGARIFAVDKYAISLESIIEARDIHTHFRHNLIEVRPDSKEAIFEHLDDKHTVAVKYDLLHVTPPMGPPDFIAESPLAADSGWVSVDKHTLQHTAYPNVFSLGDCSNLPTSKTGAAIRKQAPALAANLLSLRKGAPMLASYDGYTSCPLVTGYGKLILAEFDYDKNPKESFPFDQSQERYSMYALKAYGLPRMYWHGMLRGRV